MSITRRILRSLLSLLTPDPLSARLSRSHLHQVITREEMEREPVLDPNNWLPRQHTDTDTGLSRSHFWRNR